MSTEPREQPNVSSPYAFLRPSFQKFIPPQLFAEVTRDCYTQDPDEDHEVGCRTAGATTSCYCNSDGCNGAVTTHGAWKVLAAVAAVLPTAIGARMVL